MRTFYAQFSENSFCLPKRTTGQMETDGERPDGRRCPLVLPRFFSIRVVALAEQACEH
jgi:hypothetical protein